ncbi:MULTISPECIES: helix-turn-helix transcriptional regulator [Paenibacillus]|uniref:helix-turn-helix transcriptional regulator n=1 Tax=Paenibacillus TaxID=44249 RepID=UPI0022B8C58B|nr:hybrid sensor histidine kinase/response regulator transcription factor [Paenibacillus caseinilyticus]MCZ8521343.1 hybrid sensor histidine kinase/response regulator transcription factor [Paenibacillus caseinilyticus]
MMFVIRTILFVSLLFTMEHVSEKLTVPFWLGALWGITAFFIPWVCLQRHYTYYLIAEMVISGGLCLYMVSLFPEAYVAFLSPAFMIASNSAQKSYRWSGPMTILVFPALFAELSEPGSLLTMIFQFGLIYAVGFAFQLLVVNHRQSQMIRDQYAVLEHYSSQVARMTLAEERNRLSKDLHDTMGHSFTSIMMGLETLRLEVNTPEGERKLDSLVKLTRGSLDEVRQYLHQVGAAQDSLTLVESLQALTAEFQALTKVTVRIRILGDEVQVSKQVKMTLYRCLQESLTNAARHGQAGEIEVRLQFEEKQIRLVVQDNGVGTEELRAGFGLTAMKERASDLQGQVSIHSNPDEGTVVTCTLPRQVEQQEEAIRLLLVDDQPYIRESLQVMLEREKDLQVVGLAEDGEQAVEQCERLRPHVVLMDLHMPRMDGVEAAKRMKQKYPGVRVLILTTFQETEKAVEALRSGIDGYLLKSSEPKELSETIRLVHRGVRMIAQDVTSQLIQNYGGASREQPAEPDKPLPPSGLTPREMDILLCLSKGLRYKSIAAKLYLSEGTVRNYASTIYAKLGVRNRDEALQRVFGNQI